MDAYKDPDYQREQYEPIKSQFLNSDQIISIVGMRQVGKSTMMRQIIRELLENKIDPKRILYVSFDDPFLRAHIDPKQLFEAIVAEYAGSILRKDLRDAGETLYFFFDEIHQLPDWERALKTYYDRRYEVQYIVSGSSSLHLQKKNRESLLGRISEHTLWPFSFREYVEFKATEDKNERLVKAAKDARVFRSSFVHNFSLEEIFNKSETMFKELGVWEKQNISNYLRSFIVEGGFPRVWQQTDLASKHRTLWEQYVGKTLFEDLLQVAKIRRIKDLEFLFVRLLGFNGKETTLSILQKDLKMNHVTFERYVSLFVTTFLLFRVEKMKSIGIAPKRRSSNVKFYVVEPALRNALYKKDDTVFDDLNEMGYIAETLVCSVVERWLSPVRGEDRLGYYSKGGEVDFVFKHGAGVLPIEVKYRNDIPALKGLDKLVKKWKLSQSMVVTKDFDLTYRDGRLSIPLWFFLMIF